MVFSPPSKQPNVAKASTSNVEVLLLQPFARTPQLCFEDVPVGAEASRYVKVRNVLDTASTVFIERVPRDKGFAVDPEVFRLTPGTEQLVNFLWKPADDGASCRSTVSVRSSQGYKGMLVLLATVKKSTERVTTRIKYLPSVFVLLVLSPSRRILLRQDLKRKIFVIYFIDALKKLVENITSLTSSLSPES